MMRDKIEEKIRELKGEYFNVASNKAWIKPINGLAKDITLLKIKSQVDISKETKELLNKDIQSIKNYLNGI